MQRLNKYAWLVLASATLLGAGSAMAVDGPIVAGGHSFARSQIVMGYVLHLNGAGLRRNRSLGIAYAAGLYLTSESTDSPSVMIMQGPKRLELYMLSDMDSFDFSDELADAIRHNSSPTKFAAVESAMDRFANLVGDLKRGDTLALDFVVGRGVRVSVNDELRGAIDDDSLVRPILLAFIGSAPVDRKLKDSLLAGLK
ncbi:MAG: chalcone isomerase family protein [Gammaproteobacteria bacterium]|jgi:hypothetical protein